MTQELGARMTLDANGYISAMMQSIQHTNNFKKTVDEAKTHIDAINKAKAQIKVHADTQRAIENISQTKKQLNDIKKNIIIAIGAKNAASESVRKIKGEAKELVSKPFTAIFRAKDEISGVLRSITDKVFSLKTLAAGIVLGGTAKFAFDNTIGAGARLEQEQVSMKHFIGNNNKDKSASEVQKMTDDFISKLRKNANETPFGTNEVLSAGRRSINIMGGDIGKSMELVKLAENMAALNPGKNVMDAMEALGDLKTGEFERMKEFGFKFSADQFKGLVGKGKNDDLSDSEMSNAYDLLVKNKLNPVFDGGADKLSKTAAGQWSTTTGNLEAMFSDLGKTFLPAINKVLVPVNEALDRIGQSKAFEKMQQDLLAFADKGADKAVKFLDDLANNPGKIEEYKNQFKQFIADIKAGWEVAKEFGKAVGTIGTALKPVFSMVAAHPKLFANLFMGIGGLKIGGSIFKSGLDSYKNIKNILKEFPKLNSALKTITKSREGGFKGALKLPFTAFKDGFKFLKDTSKWIPGLFSITGKNIVSTFKGGGSAIKNFFGLFPKGIKGSINALKTFKDTLKGFSVIKPLQEAFKSFRSLGVMKELPKAFKSAISPLKTGFKGIGNLWSSAFSMLKTQIISNIKSIGVTMKVFRTSMKGFSIIKPLQEAFKGFKTLGVMKELPKALSAAFSPLKTVFSTLGNVIKIFSSGAVKAMRTFFSVIAANPVTAIIIGIIAIAVLLYEAWTHNWGGIREKTKDAMDKVNSAIGSVKGIMSSVKSEFKTFVEDMKKAWERLKEFFSNPITATVKFIKEGNTTFQNDPTKKNALGTSYFGGGWTWVGEHGPELMKLPGGSQIVDNRNSNKMSQGGIFIAKIADEVVVREEADIDKIVDKLVKRLDKVGYNMA